MKKVLGKFGAMMLAITLLLALSVSAFAAVPTGSLTLKGEDGSPKTTSTFTAYQLVTFNAEEISSGHTVYTNMQVTPGFTAFFTGSYTLTTISGFTFDSAQSIALANALESYISAHSTSSYATTTNGVFSNLPYGYYLIRETATSATDPTVATKPILVCVPTSTGQTAVAVTVKTSKANVDKVIVKAGTDYKSSTEDIGDTVNYRVDASIPTYADNAINITYFVTDTMSKGLTFNGTASLKVYGVASGGAKTLLTYGTDYTVTTTPSPVTAGTATTIKVDFVYSHIKSYSSVSLSYSATLNSYANIGSVGNPNVVNLTYTNNPNSGSTFTTIDHKVITYTYGIAIKKLDQDQRDLQGAIFALENAAGDKLATYTYDTFGHAVVLTSDATFGLSTVTNATGWAYFVGLDGGTYYLEELKAPAGYNLLTARIQVQIVPVTETVSVNGVSVTQPTGQWYYIVDGTTVSSTDYSKYVVDTTDGTLKLLAKVTVTNTAGFLLPGTGGIGTTLFTVGGLVLIVAAGTLLIITLKKKRDSQGG